MKYQWSAVLISVICASVAHAQNTDTLDPRTALSILLGDSIEAISPEVAVPSAVSISHSQGSAVAARTAQTSVEREIVLAPPVSRNARGSAVAASTPAKGMNRQEIAPLAGLTANYPDRVIVQRGDTLDTLIQRSMPASPFNQGFLRAAFMRLNPDVFGKGGPHRLSVGTSLHVPSQMELVSLIVGSTSAASLSRTPESSTHPSEAKDADRLMAQHQLHQDRKNWVRYP